MITRQDLAAKWRTGTHGGTYGGNAVACAAGAATVRAIKEENLLANAAARGEQLIGGLRKLQAEFPVIGDVRGLGLMVGVEFTRDGQPDTTTSKAIVKMAAGIRADAADLRHLRQRDPLDPAAGRHRGRDR